MNLVHILAQNRYNFLSSTFTESPLCHKVTFSRDNVAGWVRFYKNGTAHFKCNKGRKSRTYEVMGNYPDIRDEISQYLFNVDYAEHTPAKSLKKKRMSSFR